ncbi:MAG: hypothetical protein OHK93_007320 [Ramalina farinacea]|uniref:Aminoglycoside phosphotransferase domain-containing protein n=1 Tax=Ramalina farinacea TaxID=258253 RepID=A0AA43QK90_9LECA|nr:hypothetical protein [Ramalina farinacea]
MEEKTISEEVMDQESASVDCLVVDDSDRVSVTSADNASMLTEEREAEIACEEYDRKQAEEEASLCENIEKLCKELWPAPTTLRHRLMRCARQTRLGRVLTPAIQEPVIKRMEGGDLNHITSITIPFSYAKDSHDLILRIPNYKFQQFYRVDRDVGILSYVRKYTDIPIPFVVKSDFTTQNALEKPYVLQQRIQGTNVNAVWDSLNTAQRCQIAKQLGEVNKTLRIIKSPVAGLIEVVTDANSTGPTPNANGDESFKIIPFEIHKYKTHDVLPAITEPRAPQSVLDVLTTQLTRWEAFETAHDYANDQWQMLINVVREMDDLGVFADQTHCLCHVDLHSGNIMVDIDPVDGSVKISAVIDWDEAIFAPEFVNCRPPCWLWADEDTMQTDEDGYDPWPHEMPGAGGVPGTEDDQEIKRVFDESAGGGRYMSMAYGEAFRLARGIWRIAKDSLDVCQGYKAADRIAAEWAMMREKMMKERDQNSDQ